MGRNLCNDFQCIKMVKKKTALDFQLSSNRPTSVVMTGELEMALPDGLINDSSVFLNNSTYPYTYLTNGGSIHRFVHTGNSIEENYLNVGNDIKKLAINHDGETLAIVIDNGGGSTIILMDLISETEIARYDIDSKVIDLEYKRID